MNLIIYFDNNNDNTAAMVLVTAMLVGLIVNFILSESKKRLSKIEELIAAILVDFILNTKNIKREEKKKLGDILNKIFIDREPVYILEFLNETDFSKDDIYVKMCKKDIFYKNLLLKYLFRCALTDNFVSSVDEKSIYEIAVKIKIGKGLFNKRKFFCEKTGYQFESIRAKMQVDEIDYLTDTDEAFRRLGLTPEASVTEIKKAKRRLVKLFHPDKTNTNCDEGNKQFIEITEAYNVLKRFRKIK